MMNIADMPKPLTYAVVRLVDRGHHIDDAVELVNMLSSKALSSLQFEAAIEALANTGA